MAAHSPSQRNHLTEIKLAIILKPLKAWNKKELEHVVNVNNWAGDPTKFVTDNKSKLLATRRNVLSQLRTRLRAAAHRQLSQQLLTDSVNLRKQPLAGVVRALNSAFPDDSVEKICEAAVKAMIGHNEANVTRELLCFALQEVRAAPSCHAARVDTVRRSRAPLSAWRRPRTTARTSTRTTSPRRCRTS